MGSVLKRSRFNSLPREIALERAKNREAKRIQREGIKTTKTRPMSDKQPKQRSKSLSKAAESGKKAKQFQKSR